MPKKSFDIAVVGGFGHVGLPLGLAFVKVGLKVCLVDISAEKQQIIDRGEMPFVEYGAQEVLTSGLASGHLRTSLESSEIKNARVVIICIGTPVDEYLNPKLRHFLSFFDNLAPNLDPEQLLIIRSTVYPKSCTQALKRLEETGRSGWKMAYCPERIVQGYSMKELFELPQLVAGMNKVAETEATELFSKLSPKIIPCQIHEAELAKLFSNAWRYIQFSVTNQFYMIASDFDQDYDRVREIMMDGYGRAGSLPSAGFAAGPCLLKDTMQLAAFSKNQFMLGHAAMMVNEGLPAFIVEQLKKDGPLENKKIGILGMAFKAEIDDIRDSLSYKLGKILRFQGAEVYYSDEYAKDSTFVSALALIENCDTVIVGVPHHAYKNLTFRSTQTVVDLWGHCKKPGET